tara:strand:+ start:145 stop:840 length:696 start_codon:yes stop_codon:yes gene_type:complete
MDLKSQILVALGIDKSIKLEWQSKLEDGTIVVSTSDTLAESVDVSVLTEDGTTIPLPIGTYKTDDGVTFVVAEEGVVDSVSESETEEVVEAAEDEECPNGYDDDGNCKEDEKEEKTEAADVEDWEGMEKRIQNLEDAVASLKEDKEGGDDESEEMAAEPTSNPKSIKTTEVKEFSIEELKAENEKLKTQLAESPADAPINTNKFSSERPTPSRQELKRMTKQEKYLYNLYK